jgi:hypothetical protein
MQDLMGKLGALRRPQLMVTAAQKGADGYDRERDLPVLLGRVPRCGPAMMALLEQEEAMEASRVSRTPGYAAADHLMVLIALMGEARELRRIQLV